MASDPVIFGNKDLFTRSFEGIASGRQMTEAAWAICKHAAGYEGIKMADIAKEEDGIAYRSTVSAKTLQVFWAALN